MRIARTMKRRKQRQITNLIESVFLVLTAAAGIFLLVSLVAMVENMSVSGTPLIINLICLVWIGIFSVYYKLVNK